MRRLVLAILLLIPSTVYGQVRQDAGDTNVTMRDNANRILGKVTFTAPQHIICDSGCGGGGGSTIDQGLPNTDANAWPISVTFGGSAIDPRLVTVQNFPTTATTSAISVRCVNTAGNAFESCAGSGGGGTGQQTMANSSPVVIASDQSAISVTGTFFPPNQPISGTVTVTDGAGALNTIIDSGTITAVTNITNAVTIGTLPNENQQTMANSISVAVAFDQTAIPITDNGGSLTVDGAFFQATQPVSLTVIPPLDDTTSGTVALNALNVAATVDVRGYSSYGCFMSAGTFAGTLTFEVSSDGVEWHVSALSRNGAQVTTITLTNPNPASSLIGLPLGLNQAFRVRVSSYTSGTADIYCRASSITDAFALSLTAGVEGVAPGSFKTGIGGIDSIGLFRATRLSNVAITTGTYSIAVGLSPDSPLPVGSNIIGKVGIDQTTPGTTNRVDIGSSIPGTGATNLGKAEDAAVGSGDVAVGFLGVRTDTATQTTSTNGDYIFPSFDTYGAQYTRPHPNGFSCFVQAVTVMTQCQAAPAAGLRAYVTGFSASNQAATVQTLDIVFGTGANCATAPTALTHKYQMGTVATTTSPFLVADSFNNPLIPTAANAICIRPSAATAFGATITGFIAP